MSVCGDDLIFLVWLYKWRYSSGRTRKLFFGSRLMLTLTLTAPTVDVCRYRRHRHHHHRHHYRHRHRHRHGIATTNAVTANA